MALTKEQILQAADRLMAAGTIPTLAAVRATVGGGSYTTINEALKEWKARQQCASTPIREPAPDNINKRLNDLGTEIWATALELANARLTSEREALEVTRTQMEIAQQEATELADQLSAELETLQEQYCKALEELQIFKQLVEKLQQENANLSHELATAHARTEETNKRVDDLKTELQHAHAENHTQRQQHLEEIKHLQHQVTITNDHLQAQSRTAVRLQTELSQVQAQAANAQHQQEMQQQRHLEDIQRLKELVNQAQMEREKALQDANANRENAAEMRGELEVLRTQNAALLASLQPVVNQPPVNS